MLALALPVITAEIGWIMMGIVDTIMVGPLGPAAIGAVGVGSTLFMTGAVFGIGLLMGLDTFVSQSFGAGRIAECHRWLFNGLALGALFSVPLMLAIGGMVLLLPRFGFHDEVLVLIRPYVATLVWSALPLMLFAAFRRYLQAMSVVRPVMIALVTANLVNVAGNHLLISGRYGFPALGVVGSAWATVIARVYLAVFLFAVVVHRERRYSTGLHDVSMWPEGERLVRLFRLGLPAALQITVEVGVFGAASALAGGVGPAAVAAGRRRARGPGRGPRRRRGRARGWQSRAPHRRRLHGHCGRRVRRDAAPAAAPVHGRSRRHRDRSLPAGDRGALPAVRRRAGGVYGPAARARQHAHGDGMARHRPLDRRPAPRLRAVFLEGMGSARPLDRGATRLRTETLPMLA
jgi:hypothetical protein